MAARVTGYAPAGSGHPTDRDQGSRHARSRRRAGESRSGKERLWVPYQAGWEFFENRPKVIGGEDKIYQELEKPLRDAKAKLDSLFNTLRAHPVVTDEEQTKILRHVEDALSVVNRLSGGRDGKLEDALRSDTVLELWQRILSGRLGDAPSEEVLADRIKMAAERYAKATPPGYLDADKESNTYGDALLWLDLIEKTRQSPGPVLLITNDVKEDWYRRQSGRTIGPRVELVREMESVGGRYYQQRLDAFLKRGAQVVDKRVSEESLEAIYRTSERGLTQQLANRLFHEIRLIAPEATISQPISSDGPTPDLVVNTRQGVIGVEFKNYSQKVTSREIEYLELMLSAQSVNGLMLVSSSSVSPAAVRLLTESAARHKVALRIVEVNDFASPEALAHSFLEILDQITVQGSMNKKWRL